MSRRLFVVLTVPELINAIASCGFADCAGRRKEDYDYN